MAGRIRHNAQTLTYTLIVLCGIVMILGSLYFRLNYRDQIDPESELIEYSYSSLSANPTKRGRFRMVQISFETIREIIPKGTKDVRMVIGRASDIEAGPISNGAIFSIVIERMSRYKAILFDYDRCVKEYKTRTDIVIVMLVEGLRGPSMRKVVIHIDRVTDTISLSGHEINVKDILDEDVAIALNKLKG